MNRIASHSERVAVSILSFLFIVEEVSLLGGAVTVYYQKSPPNEFGASLLAAGVLAILSFSNLLAFSATYFYLRKLIKLEGHLALLWALIAAAVAPLLTLFAPPPQEYALHYFFGTYAVVIGYLTMMRIYAVIRNRPFN